MKRDAQEEGEKEALESLQPLRKLGEKKTCLKGGWVPSLARHPDPKTSLWPREGLSVEESGLR